MADLLQLRRYLQRQQAAMITTLRRLVEAESPSHNKTALDRLGKLLAGEFRKRGGRVVFHRQKAAGDHLEISFGPTGRPTIMLLGHFDTVWEVGTLAEMPFRVAGGRAWGPGVFDMKSGIVMMLFALDALRRLRGGLRCGITILLNSDEEVGSSCSRALTERLARKSAAVLVLEPAHGLEGALKTARKGVGEYTLKVTGIPSHSGLDFEQGASAVLELARQIVATSKFTDLRRGITVNPGVIRGGTRSNVVAAQAAVQMDARVARRAQAAALDRKFRGLQPFDQRCSIQVSGGINRPPLERSPQGLRLFRLARRLAAELKFELQEAAVGGGSDGNFTAALGVPTLDGLGAVGEGAHARSESILLDELPRRTALLAALIDELSD